MTLPTGWVATSLGEIADTKLGKMLDAARNRGEATPYLRNINVRWGTFELSDLQQMPVFADEFSELRVRDGDIFACEGGEPGRAAVWRGGSKRLVFQKALHRVRPLDEIEPDFIARFLRYAAANDLFAELLTGTTIKHLPQIGLQRVPVDLPPAAEQRRIAAKLDALMDRLVQTRAKLDPVPVLSRRTLAAAYDEAFGGANSAQTCSLSSLTPPEAPIIYGILQPGPNEPDGVPYVRPTEIENGAIKLSEVRRTTRDIAEQYCRATIRSGDILLTIVGTIGKVAVVPDQLDGGNITQSSCRIRPAKSLVDRDYLRHWLLSPHAWRQYERKRLGTAVPRLNIRDIREFEVPILPLGEQRRVAARLDRLEQRVHRLNTEAARARALLDRLESAILAKAFRGELVPQDANDEPASVLLERIRARRAAAPKPKRGRRVREATDA